MTKLKQSILLALIAITFSSCKKDSTKDPNNTTNPVAAFSVSSGIITIGSNFDLINESTNSDYYKWEINGVQYSTDKDIYMKLDSAANYTIKLTATDISGKSNSVSKSITVTNQLLQYAGTWQITETEINYPYSKINYLSDITFDNRGNANFSKYSFYQVPTTLTYFFNASSPIHSIDNYIVDLVDNVIINSSISFNTISSQKQLLGEVYYHDFVSIYKYNIIGIKK